MGATKRRDERVSVGIVECLTETGEEECDGVERERRKPGAQDVREDLECGAEEEDGAEVKVLAYGAVGEGGEEPAREGGAVSGDIYCEILNEWRRKS